MSRRNIKFKEILMTMIYILGKKTIKKREIMKTYIIQPESQICSNSIYKLQNKKYMITKTEIKVLKIT